MEHGYKEKYFFSLQPFWDNMAFQNLVSDEEAQILISSVIYKQGFAECVPGNGQIAIMISGPEDFKGYCYGVMRRRETISLHGLERGCFIRFSPGSFAKICDIPAKEISSGGLPLKDLFSGYQIAQIKDAMDQEDQAQALFHLFGRWTELQGRDKVSAEKKLAKQIVKLIWACRGNIRMNWLEEQTAYSSRYLQEVLTRQVGISPKQMCRQVRFQNSLMMVQKKLGQSQVQLANDLGFSDQAHYCREFKSFTGFSPFEFQKRLR